MNRFACMLLLATGTACGSGHNAHNDTSLQANASGEMFGMRHATLTTSPPVTLDTAKKGHAKKKSKVKAPKD